MKKILLDNVLIKITEIKNYIKLNNPEKKIKL